MLRALGCGVRSRSRRAWGGQLPPGNTLSRRRNSSAPNSCANERRLGLFALWVPWGFFFSPPSEQLLNTHSYFYTEFLLQTHNQLGTLKSKQRKRREPDDITEETQGGRQTRREPVSSQRKVTKLFLSLYSAYSLQQTSTRVSPSTFPRAEFIK